MKYAIKKKKMNTISEELQLSESDNELDDEYDYPFFIFIFNSSVKYNWLLIALIAVSGFINCWFL